ncbi:hypothetical protein ACIPWF_03465 [Paenarthrobacter sp. NPDC089989]|uniref:hypothetical protein n=1 Tax=unclassified Paenarthrobacter TaxID=2634190 RepID=UPI00382B6E3B
MRRMIPLAVFLVMLVGGCTAPAPQPSASSSPAASAGGTVTAAPSPSPSSVPLSDPPSQGDIGPGDDEPGRYSFRCTSLDASPEVQLSSLAEVWAATNYTRMGSCEVGYEDQQPFVATPREAEAVSAAGQQDAGDGGLAVMLDILRLCTRISDEAGPDGFAGSARATLLAAAQYCPDAPQGKILDGWANGTRVGDGTHAVGEQMEPGSYQVVKQGVSAEGCAWSVAAPDGGVVDSGGLPEAAKTVDLAAGQKFTSDKCGIWGKMY